MTDGGGPTRWQAPALDHPERQALPGHLRPAAAALFDGLPEALPGRVIDEAASRLTTAAATLAPAVELTVDAFRVRAAATCPATAVPDPDEPFAWTPATAARTLGLRAVAHHLRGAAAGAGVPVETAVDAVVAELIDTGGERSPGPWLAGLPPPARAVALAQARRWAEQAVAWLPLRLVGRRELRFLDDDWWRARARAAPPSGTGTVRAASPSEARPAQAVPPSGTGTAQATPPSRAGLPRTAPSWGMGPVGAAPRCGSERAAGLVVHGRRDITVEVAGHRVAITVAGGAASGPGLADVDAVTALASLLCDPRGRLVRVVRVHPASGAVLAVDVTAALVERGVEVVMATAAVLAQDVPAMTPGPGCTWCPRRAVCGPGGAWLDRSGRRSMGLPLPGGRDEAAA